MINFILKRVFFCILVLFITSILTFVMLRIAPGGPFDAEKTVDEKVNRQLLEKYRLDRSIPEQYVSYIGDIVLRADFGPSFTMPDSTVNEVLKEHIPVSFVLGLAAMFLGVSIGIAFGVIAVLYYNSGIDGFVMIIAVIGIAVPNFVLAPLLFYLLALKLHIIGIAFNYNISTAILPIAVLSLPVIAKVARLTRGGLLEVMQSDFIRSARAKGMSETAVLVKHGLRVAILPVVSFLGPACAAVMTGSIVVERIFAIDGLGNCFFNAAINRDYTVVMGLVLLYSTLLVVFNAAVDMAYGFLDPRVRIRN